MATSFLGISALYLLQNVGQLDTKKQESLISFLKNYHGPNKILFFTQAQLVAEVPDSWCLIDTPLKIDKKLFVSLTQWYGVAENERTKQFIDYLFTGYEQVPLDTACLLIEYMLLVGANTIQFFGELAEHIMVSDQSLFALSQAFFKKNSKQFFKQWQRVHHHYSPQFWLSFWSDQLMRATLYVALQEEQKVAYARKISQRLPFSFINYDWKNYTPRELQATHAFIYSLDHRLKNGGDDQFIDLLYSSFFANYFANSGNDQAV